MASFSGVIRLSPQVSPPGRRCASSGDTKTPQSDPDSRGVVGHEDITALVQKDKRAPLAMASADVPLRSPVPMTAAPEPKAGTLERKPRLGNVNGP